MTKDDEKGQFNPDSYPALLEFLPAYLHEDFVKEYGSAAEAFRALIADASGDQIRDVKGDWQALRHALAGQLLDNVHQALRELGSAWQPQSEQELQAVDEILCRAQA